MPGDTGPLLRPGHLRPALAAGVLCQGVSLLLPQSVSALLSPVPVPTILPPGCIQLRADGGVSPLIDGGTGGLPLQGLGGGRDLAGVLAGELLSTELCLSFEGGCPGNGIGGGFTLLLF